MWSRRATSVPGEDSPKKPRSVQLFSQNIFAAKVKSEKLCDFDGLALAGTLVLHRFLRLRGAVDGQELREQGAKVFQVERVGAVGFGFLRIVVNFHKNSV